MRKLYEKEGTQKLLASLLSIFLGLTVGAVVVFIVGLLKSNIGIINFENLSMPDCTPRAMITCVNPIKANAISTGIQGSVTKSL